MNKRMLFLINPNAGKAEIRTKLVEILDVFIKHNWSIEVHITQRPNEIPYIIEEKASFYDMIVCSGGDGTFNETVTGLMHLENPIPLGYIPAGTVNDFASSLKIPKNMLEAAEVIVHGKSFMCDIGKFEERYFSYIAAFGAFTDVAYRTSQQFKNIFGKVAYILEGIKALPTIKSYYMTLENEDEIISGYFIFGMITNSFSVAGIKSIPANLVSMNDGLLEVLLVREPKSPLDIQFMINDILTQNYSEEFFYQFKTKELKIYCEEPVPWTLDGEYGGDRQEVKISNIKQALNIVVADSDEPEKKQPRFNIVR